jgi:hypothetical protein
MNPRRSGGIGRRAGLKIRCPKGRVGSIPTFGTNAFGAGCDQAAIRYAHGRPEPGTGAEPTRVTIWALTESATSTLAPGLGGCCALGFLRKQLLELRELGADNLGGGGRRRMLSCLRELLLELRMSSLPGGPLTPNGASAV